MSAAKAAALAIEAAFESDCYDIDEAARAALTALVESEDVRAALVEPMFDALTEYVDRRKLYTRADLCPPLIDAVLAALRPEARP